MTAFVSASSLRTGHFRLGSNVQVVSLGMFATNVELNAQGVSVPFTQHKNVLAEPEVRAKDLDLKFQGLSSLPVTPAWVDRLVFFFSRDMTRH